MIAFPDVRLELDRLTLRPFTLADVPDVVAGCSDEVTQRWLPLPAPYTEELAASWCTHDADALRLAGDAYNWRSHDVRPSGWSAASA